LKKTKNYKLLLSNSSISKKKKTNKVDISGSNFEAKVVVMKETY